MLHSKSVFFVLGATLFTVLAAQADADIVAISFADPGGGGTWNSGDPDTSPLTATPGNYGTLGWFSAGGTGFRLCFGNASGDFSGGPTFDGLFNDDPAGVFSTATTFASGDLIDADREQPVGVLSEEQMAFLSAAITF